MRSNPRRLVSTGRDAASPILTSPSSPPIKVTSIPRLCANFRITASGTTPAISWISRGSMVDGGSVEAESRAADCRYVMARRRSPEDVEMRADITSCFTGTCSTRAICSRRCLADEESRGLKRNFEQRDASGSMILGSGFGSRCVAGVIGIPRHVVAN